MIFEYREILEGLVRVQAAGMLATGIVAVRGIQLTLRQGEVLAAGVLGVIGRPENPQGSRWDGVQQQIYDSQVDYLREVVGLPRLSFMFFLGELDRLRTPVTDEEDELGKT